MGVGRVIGLLLVLACTPVWAAEGDREIARLHFLLGTEHYDRGEYEKALVEFEAARRAQALPELDFNMARCLEKLGRKADAIAAYERFLLQKRDQEVSERLQGLRDELARKSAPSTSVQPSSPAPTTRRRLPIASIALGGLTTVSLVTGAALLGVTAPEYDRVSTTCIAPCPRAQWEHLETQAYAGYAMLSIAGVAAVIDIALWVDWARKRPSRPLRAEAR
jgi:tetratricopeptide (TPR) repeat protein